MTATHPGSPGCIWPRTGPVTGAFSRRPFFAAIDVDGRAARWRASLRDPARTTFLAEDRTGARATLAGFAEIGPCRDDDAPCGTGELMALHVAHEYWRRGIGGALHARTAEALAAQGFTRAALWVLRDNERARAFYTATGWKPDGRERHRVVRGTDVYELRYGRGLRR